SLEKYVRTFLIQFRFSTTYGPAELIRQGECRRSLQVCGKSEQSRRQIHNQALLESYVRTFLICANRLSSSVTASPCQIRLRIIFSAGEGLPFRHSRNICSHNPHAKDAIFTPENCIFLKKTQKL
ncbi:MAG: hypothetical protein IJW40_12210, partial [Clostridia bacterium]|nr:hypothetical protein [Clostridia bacterium]